jgi:hypothetical protein
MSVVRIRDTLRVVAEAMIAIGILAMSIAPIVLTIEVGEWLSNQEWPGWSVEDGLGLFGIERGETAETAYQRWLDVLMAVPLTLALFMIGANLLLGGFKLGERELDRMSRNTVPAGVPFGWLAPSVPSAPRPSSGLTEALVWSRSLLSARRAEAKAQYDRAVKLLARASSVRPLPPHDKVAAAILMLRLGMHGEPEAVFRALSRQFADSPDSEQRYLDFYCRAMLAMLAADTAQTLAHSKEARCGSHDLWLDRRFPLPSATDD